MILPEAPRPCIALYTDADVTTDLAPALRWRGYRAQSAAEAGNLTISDEAQLRYATEQGMAILTYNAQDFIPLAQAWYVAGRGHSGIIFSDQFSRRQFGELLRRILRLLNNLTAAVSCIIKSSSCSDSKVIGISSSDGMILCFGPRYIDVGTSVSRRERALSSNSG